MKVTFTVLGTKPSAVTRGAICKVTPTFTYWTCCDTPLTPDKVIAVRIGSASPVMILAVEPLCAAIRGRDTIRILDQGRRPDRAGPEPAGDLVQCLLGLGRFLRQQLAVHPRLVVKALKEP